MIVRAERPEDVAAAHAVHVAAFQREVEARLADELRADGDVLDALVAEVDGAVVGAVVLSRATIDGRGSVALGPIGVLPAHQRQGIGSALVDAALAAATGRRASEVVLLGDPAYYSRFGFVDGVTLGVLAPDPSWGRYFQVRPLSAARPGAFRYAPAFDRA